MLQPDTLKKQAVQHLKKLRVFADLQDWEYEKILELCKTLFFRPGETIFKQGDDGDNLFVLLSGEVEIVVKGKGVVHVMKRN